MLMWVFLSADICIYACLFVCLSVYLCVHLSVYLSVCLSLCLSVYLFVSLCVCLCPVSLLLCHQHVQSSTALCDMWRQALQSGFVMTLCRDEVLSIHQFIISYFDSIKG